MAGRVCPVWCELMASLIATTFLGMDLALNVYAVALKQTFNFTQTEVELIAVSGAAGMGASLIEPFLTSRFGYKVGYTVIWLTTSGPVLLLGLAVVFRDILRHWCTPISVIQFLLCAGDNAGNARLATTSMDHLAERHTGKLVGVSLAATAAGKLVYGGLFQLFSSDNLQGFFFTIAASKAVCFGVCFGIHRSEEKISTTEGIEDVLSETMPLKHGCVCQELRLVTAQVEETLSSTDNIWLHPQETPSAHTKLSHATKQCLKPDQMVPEECTSKSQPSGVDNITSHYKKSPADPDEIQHSTENIPSSRDKTPSSRDRIPPSRDKIPPPRDKIPSSRDKIPPSRDKIPTSRDMIPTSGDKNPVTSIVKSRFFHLTFWPSAVMYGILFTYMNNITSIAYSMGIHQPLNTVYLLSATTVIGRFTFGLLFDKAVLFYY